MEIYEALLLGIIQGLTEFLPVSSSGHLELGKALLGDESMPRESMLFTIVVHAATALATLLVYRSDVSNLIKGTFVSNSREEQIFSAQTAYQVTSILEGAIKRGTGKKLKSLNLDIAGKTGTTNNNFDAWFIGYNSNLVVGVYIGFDNPKTLGKYETGSKAALPIFKDFVKNALYKEDFKEFKIPEGIYLTSLNYDTGLKPSLDDKNTIIEALKAKDIAKHAEFFSFGTNAVSYTHLRAHEPPEPVGCRGLL